jgi:hypothetical protein
MKTLEFDSLRSSTRSRRAAPARLRRAEREYRPVLAGQSYAIKAEIDGRTFCAVGVQDAVANEACPTRRDRRRVLRPAIGCGGTS